MSAESTHLWSFIKERIPYFKEDVTDNAVHKYHQKPVEGDEGVVYFVLFKMGVKSRQLLTHEVSEYPLVYLEREQRGKAWGLPGHEASKPEQLCHPRTEGGSPWGHAATQLFWMSMWGAS